MKSMPSLRSLVPRLSPSNSPSTSSLEPRRVSTLEKMPSDILARICVTIIDLSDCPWVLGEFALVCKRWYRAARSDFVWDHIVRKTFVVFPLVRLVELHMSDPSNTGTPQRPSRHDGQSSPRRGNSPVNMLTPEQAMSLSSTQLKSASRMDSLTKAGQPGTFVPPFLVALKSAGTKYCDVMVCIQRVAEYHNTVEQQHHVESHHGFVLNVMIGFALCCWSIFTIKIVLFHERVLVDDSAIVFRWLWLTYVFIMMTIIGNIVMTAHFEPYPLAYRVSRHLQLIMLSTAALVACLFTVALPTFLIQRNSGLGAADRLSWFWCLSPVNIALASWQLEVVYSMRHVIFAWFSHPYFSLTALYFLTANLTPTVFNVAVYSLSDYLESGSELSLVMAAVPLLLVLMTLTIVFTLDFVARRRFVDGASALCLWTLAMTPLSLLLWTPRGLSFAPLAVASTGFFLTHLWEFRNTILDKEHSD